MTVSYSTDNKIGISRFTRKEKKNLFTETIFFSLVKNYSQSSALFDVLTIRPLLVLAAVKRKPSSLFRG